MNRDSETCGTNTNESSAFMPSEFQKEEECGEKIIANMSQICQNKKQHIQATK